MTLNQWLSEVAKHFEQAEEFELARAIYPFEADFHDGLTPKQAYENFDAWVAA